MEPNFLELSVCGGQVSHDKQKEFISSGAGTSVHNTRSNLTQHDTYQHNSVSQLMPFHIMSHNAASPMTVDAVQGLDHLELDSANSTSPGVQWPSGAHAIVSNSQDDCSDPENYISMEQPPSGTLSAHVPILKRSNRCLRCKHDKGKRPCKGYPLCQRCCIDSHLHARATSQESKSFVNWHSWVVQMNVFSAARSADTFQNGICYNEETLLKLELRFSSGSQEPDPASYFVNFAPSEQHERIPIQIDGLKAHRRPPAFDTKEWDHAMLNGTWVFRPWTDMDGRATDADKELWAGIERFTGYLNFTYQLKNVTVELSAHVSQAMWRNVAAEMIYTIGWQLQRLHYEILRCLDQIKEDQATGQLRNFPAMVLYSLEAFYCLLLKMRPIDWMLDSSSSVDTLLALQDELNTSVDRLVDQILSIECRISANYLTSRKIGRRPEFHVFACQTQETTGFPDHITVAASPCQQARVNLVPPPTPGLPFSSPPRWRLVDFFTV